MSSNKKVEGLGDSGPEPTMAFQLPDPGIRKLHGELPNENLEGMQKVLGRCEVTHVTPALEGFNYRGFVQNLQGISKVELGDARLYALLTRNNAFILANVIAEKLHDLVKGLMDLHLGDRITLKDGDKVRYLYKVPSEQMERLRWIANQNRLYTAHAFPFQDLAGFRKRLASSGKVSGLDLQAFAARVTAVSNLYEDRAGNGYHRLTLEDGTAHLLYINPKSAVPGAAAFACGAARLSLIREG